MPFAEDVSDPGCSCSCIPDARQITGQPGDGFALVRGESPLSILVRLGESPFQLRHTLQLLIPSPLRLPSAETVIRVYGIILSLCLPRLIACLFQLHFPLEPRCTQILFNLI